jgi:signal transduction histidine kinase
MLGLLIALFGHAQVDGLSKRSDSLLLQLDQAQTDRAKADLNTALHELYLKHDPFEAMAYARRSLAYNRAMGDSARVGLSYGDIMNAHFVAGSHSDSLLAYLQPMEAACTAANDSSLLVEIHWGYAMYYGNIGQPDKQMEHYLKALEVTRSYAPSAEQEAMLLNNIGSTLYTQEKVAAALSYFEQALALAENSVAKADMLQNCATLYEELGRSADTIEQYYEEALNLYRQEHDNGGIALVLLKKGRRLDAKGQFEAAMGLYREAEELIEAYDIGHMWYKLYRTLAQHHQTRGNYREVARYAKAAIAVVETQQNYFNTATVYEMLHEAYAELGDYEAAYAALYNWTRLQDTVQNDMMRQRTEELETKYQAEQKEMQNQLLKAQQANAEKSIRNRNLIIAVALLLLLLALGWLGAVLLSARKKREYKEQLEATVDKRTKDLQQANQELEQANYELRSFSYIASHDIKEPIRNIGNYAGLINRRLPKPQRTAFQDYFEIIESSVKQLYTLAEDFTEYISLSKTSAFQLKAVELEELMRRVEAIVQPLIEQKRGVVRVGELPKIRTNDSLLFIALKNLVENGLKYNESAIPCVEVSYRQAKGQHLIVVKDNGMGIEPAYQQQIFQMFKRLHSREAYQGSGIGLALVELAAQKLNGRVELESTLGEGSTFTLYVPVGEGKAQAGE